MTGKEEAKDVILYGSLGLGTSAGLFLLSRHFYKKLVLNSAEKRSLDEGNPATFAKQLKMAFDNDNYAGWGTNEAQVFKIFEVIPSKDMYRKVQKAYFNLYNRNLNTDLESELSSAEYNQIVRIINSKRE